MVDLMIFPVIALGILLGAYELILMHRDEHFRGSHWLGHGLHSAIFMILILLAINNLEWFITTTGLDKSLPSWLVNPWLLRAVLGLILIIKTFTISAVTKGASGKGMHISFIHAFVLAILAVTSPLYLPIVVQFLPPWMQ